MFILLGLISYLIIYLRLNTMEYYKKEFFLYKTGQLISNCLGHINIKTFVTKIDQNNKVF